MQSDPRAVQSHTRAVQSDPRAVRRRARSDRPPLLRNPFRNAQRRAASLLNDDPSALPVFGPARPPPFLQRRRPLRPSPEPLQKPIYIYPGLLRVVRDKAIALDNQCPAVLYKCRECRRDACAANVALRGASGEADPDWHAHTAAREGAASLLAREDGVGGAAVGAAAAAGAKCPHRAACSICLEEFHEKDLVRKLPCNANHIFHSKCILDWFAADHRCPLCNRTVTNTLQARLNAHRVETGSSLFGPRPPEAADTSSVDTRVTQRSMSLPAQAGRGDVQDVSHRLEEWKATVDRGSRKQKEPRTYSYIAHDNVRMELNPVVPI